MTKEKKHPFGCFLHFITNPYEIIGTYAIKPTKLNQIVNFELGTTILNMAVSLLRLVDYFSNLALRKIPVLS